MSSERIETTLAPVTSEEFRHACGRFATGITIATVLDGTGAPHGLTVNSFSSVSLEPPLGLICLGHAVSLIDTFRASPYFGLSVLSEAQRPLSDRFARKGCDRFDGVQWIAGQTGVPLIPDALAWMEFAVENRVRAGDHDIFIGKMVRATVNEGDPLLYFASRYRRVGE
jgi:flavin reductase (DIM6/NTAB) family NADH-FMN oxidoreductase RutF